MLSRFGLLNEYSLLLLTAVTVPLIRTTPFSQPRSTEMRREPSSG
jgi:hypothetical protein